jgi:hypothetical protein
VTEPASRPPARPASTWQPIVLWSAGIVLAAGLTWFVAAVAVPVWQTDRILRRVVLDEWKYFSDPEDIIPPREAVQQLGGPEAATKKILAWRRLNWMVPRSKGEPRMDRDYCEMAVRRMLGYCEKAGDPFLISELRSGNAQAREDAAFALGCSHEGSSETVEALVAALQDRDSRVRVFAAQSLGFKGAREAVPALAVALKDESESVRYTAATALGNIGPAAAEAIPGLEKLLQDSDHSVRADSAAALQRIRSKEPPK